MLYNIEYVYGKDFEGNNTLIGAKVFSYDGETTYKQEIYVGIKYSLQDVLSNKSLADFIGVDSLAMFEAKYQKFNATGVIYFPQLKCYEFLEKDDIVLPWISDDLAIADLEAALELYKRKEISNSVAKKLADKKMYLESLDPEDPMAEWLGISFQRRVSNR